MKYTIILLAFLVSGCLTVKKVQRNCDLFMTVCEVPVKKEVEIITNTVTEIVYRDTTIYIKVPGKTVIKKVPVYINKGIVNSEQSYLSTPFAESTAQVVNSKLEHYLAQTDSTLQLQVKDGLKTIKIQEKQIKVLREKFVVTVKENTNWAKFCIKVVWGLLIVIVLGIAYLIYRFKSNILGLFK